MAILEPENVQAVFVNGSVNSPEDLRSASIAPNHDMNKLAAVVVKNLTTNQVNGGLEYKVSETPLGTIKEVKIITIGAGASGINMAYQVKKHLRKVTHVVYEKNEGLGGTWFENRYPGCKCDIRR